VYALLRFFKVLGVALLFTGSIGALLPRDLRDRRRFAYALAGPGFILSWACGFLLVRQLEISFLTGWVLEGVGLSLVSLQGVLYTVGREGRRTWGSAVVVLAPLLATLAVMIFKP
jgi:hypothetical protein